MRLVALLLVLAAGALATGCGGVLGAAGGKELTLGYIGWDENVAVSNLTKVLLEEDLGYEKVIIGIEPGSAVHPQIKNKVIPGYDLDMKLVESSTPAMLSELKMAYDERDPIVFYAWSPHWMNLKYDFRYLKDPKDLMGDFNDPAEISTIVNKDLPREDPAAYAFLKAISLDEEQVNQIEADINEAGDPVKGVKNWLEGNRDTVQPWIDAAKKAQEV
jgi:glycine betaine/proline transport system substrate-binding protein